MKIGKQIRNKKLLLIPYFLLIIFIAACGRRGDPIAITPYQEIGAIKDLTAVIKDNNIHLSWGMPDDKDFPEEAIKGFVIFRSAIAEGLTIEECECMFRPIDFIDSDSRESRLFGFISDDTFEYIDKKAIRGQSYVYKIVIMDKDSKMGKDSNLVLVKGIEREPENAIIPPEAPTGVIAVYTQQSVVITWKEVRGGDKIKYYNIYRSEGEKFVFIGKTTAFAFTDRNVAPSKKYYYRVTAVSDIEGHPSEEIEVLTDSPWN